MDSTDVDTSYLDDTHTSKNYKYCEAPGCDCFGCTGDQKTSATFSLVATVCLTLSTSY